MIYAASHYVGRRVARNAELAHLARCARCHRVAPTPLGPRCPFCGHDEYRQDGHRVMVADPTPTACQAPGGAPAQPCPLRGEPR